MDTVTKTRKDTLKTASMKLVQQVSEATGAFIGNRITDKIKTYVWYEFKKCWKNSYYPRIKQDIFNRLGLVL